MRFLKDPLKFANLLVGSPTRYHAALFVWGLAALDGALVHSSSLFSILLLSIFIIISLRGVLLEVPLEKIGEPPPISHLEGVCFFFVAGFLVFQIVRDF